MEQERVEQGARAVAIIRDKDGNPRFDDPDNVPDAVMRALTPKDREYLNTLRND